jgi:predicted transcriptional regulator of viral defense system
MNYNISTKGSDTMTQIEQIKKLIAASDGMIQTSQVTDAGIAKAVLYQYIKENDMEQIAHGVYATQDSWTDAMYLVHLRCKQAVFSHETALFLHDLTDREPLEYEITVKTGYNPSKLKGDGIRVYTIKKELHEEGIIMMQTPFGHSVPVYNMERTICDIIRNRNNTEMQTFKNALKQYAKRKDKNLRLLMQYAGRFHVEKILRQYLEILL